MKLSLLSFAIFLLLGIYACQTTVSEPSLLDNLTFAPQADGLTLPQGFQAVVVADSLGVGRFLAVRDNGDVYIHLRSTDAAGNSMVALRDTDGDGQANIREHFGPYPGTGIRIHKSHLYFATPHHVYRSALVDGQLLPASEVDTIAVLEGGDGGHSEKTFTFDHIGNMYVNVGSLTNCCEAPMRTPASPGVDPCVELEKRAGIWRFNDTQPGQVQTPEMRYATGIRNAVALHWDSASQRLYALQHGRDDLHRYWPERFTPEQNIELPAEEFMQVSEGDDFGWPYCYFDPIEGKRFLNPEYGGDGQITERCEDRKLPLVGFPGHWGPNDLLFYQGSQFPERYRHGAFIAFHGSWNRLGAKQAGYNVAFVPMRNGQVTGEYEIFADGFMGSEPIDGPGAAKHRPCGLSEGPDGSLYIVDSVKGRVWRIVYRPEA